MDVIFGAFLIMAGFLEICITRGKERSVSQLFDRFEVKYNLIIKPVYNSLLARFLPIDKSIVEKELNEISFSPEQMTFIQKWIEKSITLMEIPEKKKGKRSS